ncbi:MAG: four helix bundle protein [Patescibacteria group bacterium]
MKRFTKLIAWQKAHQLVLSVYKTSQKFPASELYALTNQIRRAAISITSNIAEGFGRNHKREKTQFCYLALGSLSELQNQLITAHDLGYLPKKEFETLVALSEEVHRLTYGLIRHLEKEH